MARPRTENKLKSWFLDLAQGENGVARLFAFLPDVLLFAKDRAGRFVYLNAAFLRLLGCDDESQVIGRSDPDFFPPHLCETYAADDRTVFTTSRPVVDRVELIRNRDGRIDWYSTTKAPVFGRDGKVAALVAVTRDLKQMRSACGRYLEMAPVVETIMDRYAEPIEIPALAKQAGLSVSQFERRFKRKFGKTPHHYLTEVRLKAAAELLAGTDLTISRIADETGFYDQSHLTNHFVRRFNETPLRYRARQVDGVSGRDIHEPPPTARLRKEPRGQAG